MVLAEGAGFEPAVPVSQYDSLANCWFQPLTHPSFGKANLRIVFLYPQIFSTFIEPK